jgi:hypothetical protein
VVSLGCTALPGTWAQPINSTRISRYNSTKDSNTTCGAFTSVYYSFPIQAVCTRGVWGPRSSALTDCRTVDNFTQYFYGTWNTPDCTGEPNGSFFMSGPAGSCMVAREYINGQPRPKYLARVACPGDPNPVNPPPGAPIHRLEDGFHLADSNKNAPRSRLKQS